MRGTKASQKERVLRVIGEQVLQDTATFAQDLKADEGTMLSLEESLDAEFGINISDHAILKCVTVADVVELVRKSVDHRK